MLQNKTNVVVKQGSLFCSNQQFNNKSGNVSQNRATNENGITFVSMFSVIMSCLMLLVDFRQRYVRKKSLIYPCVVKRERERERERDAKARLNIDCSQQGLGQLN